MDWEVRTEEEIGEGMKEGWVWEVGALQLGYKINKIKSNIQKKIIFDEVV